MDNFWVGKPRRITQTWGGLSTSKKEIMTVEQAIVVAKELCSQVRSREAVIEDLDSLVEVVEVFLEHYEPPKPKLRAKIDPWLKAGKWDIIFEPPNPYVKDGSDT